MCRISFVVLMVAFATVTCLDGKAAGSFQTKPAFPSIATVGTTAFFDAAVAAKPWLRGCLLAAAIMMDVVHAQAESCPTPADEIAKTART
jgi:uncharacterized membrane protein AbrB (regulator of aidB expression)